jgi:hypothetical protein
MKTASVLFGLVVATGVAHANPTPPKPATAEARALPAGTLAILRQLAAPGIRITRTVATPSVARPRVDTSGDAACGNVMTKVRDDACTARTATQLSVVARPLVANDGDVAAGNVMKKTKK